MSVAIRRIAPLALLFASTAPAFASPLDDAVAEYLDAPGFERADATDVRDKLIEVLPQSGQVAPGGEIGPLEKAVLLFGAQEAELDRWRMMVSYGQLNVEEDNGSVAPAYFVEVTRFNLGPTWHKLVTEEYGEENTAPLEDFGVGPNVSWRFVLQPLMGNTAALLEAARHELTDEEAAAAECYGVSCLEAFSLKDDVEWESIEVTLDEHQVGYPDEAIDPDFPDFDGVATPALVIAEMSIQQRLSAVVDGKVEWRGPEMPESVRGITPFIFASIDKNLGQEVTNDSTLGLTQLNDHAVAESWVHRLEMPGYVEWGQATVAR